MTQSLVAENADRPSFARYIRWICVSGRLSHLFYCLSSLIIDTGTGPLVGAARVVPARQNPYVSVVRRRRI